MSDLDRMIKAARRMHRVLEESDCAERPHLTLEEGRDILWFVVELAQEVWKRDSIRNEESVVRELLFQAAAMGGDKFQWLAGGWRTVGFGLDFGVYIAGGLKPKYEAEIERVDGNIVIKSFVKNEPAPPTRRAYLTDMNRGDLVPFYLLPIGTKFEETDSGGVKSIPNTVSKKLSNESVQTVHGTAQRLDENGSEKGPPFRVQDDIMVKVVALPEKP